jgi:hypothetical protein
LNLAQNAPRRPSFGAKSLLSIFAVNFYCLHAQLLASSEALRAEPDKALVETSNFRRLYRPFALTQTADPQAAE